MTSENVEVMRRMLEAAGRKLRYQNPCVPLVDARAVAQDGSPGAGYATVRDAGPGPLWPIGFLVDL
jgi:hypothetical protein